MGDRRLERIAARHLGLFTRADAAACGYSAFQIRRRLRAGDWQQAAARLVIEVDGWAFHTDPARFQRDRTRQNRLVAAGWTVLRFTWADLHHRPDKVIREVRAALTIAVSRQNT